MDSAPTNRVATGAPTGVPPTSTITLVINGKPLKLDVAPWTTLLDALREYAGLTGSKKGCDHGQCGACTVLIDGRRINPCLTVLYNTLSSARVPVLEGLPSLFENVIGMVTGQRRRDSLPGAAGYTYSLLRSISGRDVREWEP